MPVALRHFKNLRVTLPAIPQQPRGVWVAAGALVLFAGAAWGVVGSRAAADTKIPSLYPLSAVPAEMADLQKYTVAEIVEGLPVGLKTELLFKRTGVMEELAGAGPYTVFVPADNYYDYLSIKEYVGLTRTEERMLAARHVVPRSALTPTQKINGQHLTLGGERLAVHTEGGVMFVGKGFAIKGYYAQNGVVYLVSTVLVPYDPTTL